MRKTNTKIDALTDNILQTTYRLMSLKGYSAVSIREIAEEAGITRNPIFYHFNNKESLYRAAAQRQLEQKLQRCEEIWLNSGDFFDKLRRDLEYCIPNSFEENIFFNESRTSPSLADVKKEFDATFEAVYQMKLECLIAASEAGILKKDASPLKIIKEIYILYYGAVGLHNNSMFELSEKEDISDLIEGFINRLILQYKSDERVA